MVAKNMDFYVREMLQIYVAIDSVDDDVLLLSTKATFWTFETKQKALCDVVDE